MKWNLEKWEGEPNSTLYLLTENGFIGGQIPYAFCRSQYELSNGKFIRVSPHHSAKNCPYPSIFDSITDLQKWILEKELS